MNQEKGKEGKRMVAERGWQEKNLERGKGGVAHKEEGERYWTNQCSLLWHFQWKERLGRNYWNLFLLVSCFLLYALLQEREENE
jgi:hypothetical protein